MKCMTLGDNLCYCTVSKDDNIYCTLILISEFTRFSTRHLKEFVTHNKARVCIIVRSLHTVMKTLQVFYEVGSFHFRRSPLRMCFSDELFSEHLQDNLLLMMHLCKNKFV